MLKGLDPRLGADVLHTLAAMGHGDTVIVVDTNFPAFSVAEHTTLGHPLLMENLRVAEAVEAILTVLPLDTFVEDFAAWMEVVDAPGRVEPVMAEIQAAIDAAEGRPRPVVPVERFAFYDLARTSFAIIRTGERRFYGNVMLRKGVVPPDA